MSFRQRLRDRARGLRARVVFPEGDDPRVQQAVQMVAELGIAEPVVLGRSGLPPELHPRRRDVADLLRERQPDRVLDAIHALDLATDPVRLAAGLVALGEAQAAVAGAVTTTAEVVRAALWAIGPAEPDGFVSSAFYMGRDDGTALTFTDCGVVESPTPDQLARIALAAARDRRRLVGDAPRVAFLSFSTKGSAAGPLVERVQEAVARFRQLAPDVVADGELQGDAALVPEVAARKAPGSPLQGEANILVFPDLDAGNIAYKLVQHLASLTAAGPLFQGLARPMSDLSRGASADDIVDVTAMVALQASAAST